MAKVLRAQFGLDLKCLFRPNPNLFESFSLLRARGSVLQILAPQNLKEPWYFELSELAANGANLYGVCYLNGYRARG